MRISTSRMFIALANPRCGSTSIRRAVDPYSEYRSSENCSLSHHAALRTVQVFVEKLGFDLDKFFVFTTVRNPWDRAVSIYHYGLKNPASAWHAPAVSAGSFKKFLHSDMLLRHFRPEAASKPLQEGPYNISAFCADRSGAMKATAFRLEDTETMKRVLRERCAIDLQLPHVNETKRGTYKSYYDEESVKRVAYLFREDVELFGYKF